VPEAVAGLSMVSARPSPEPSRFGGMLTELEPIKIFAGNNTKALA
jgi:hypothetical protein